MSHVKLNMLLDPRGETPAAYKCAAMQAWLPKSKVTLEPLIEDGRHVKIRMRERRYLHPRASTAQRAKWQRDPWKKNDDGTDFIYEAYFYVVECPKWLLERNGFISYEGKTFLGLAKAARELDYLHGV